MSENKADPLREALERLAASIDTRINDLLCETKPNYDDSIVGINDAWDVVRKACKEYIARAALADPQPAADHLREAAFKLSCQDQFDLATAIASNVGYVLVVEPQPDRISIPTDLAEQVVAPQPAAPLGGRDEIIDGLIEDALSELHHDRDDDGDVASYERNRLRGKFTKRILAAIPQERGVDRAAIIEECAKVIEQYQERISETSNGSKRSVSPRMHGNLMGLAYADAIRALAGKETGR